MTPRIRTIALGVASLAAAFPFSDSLLVAQGIPPAPAPADAVPADLVPVPEGMEVMTRGVVHEAFAEVVTDPKPGLVVSKKPPEPIDEVPPEFKPEEAGAIWISGYWAWDDERDDFFWQSGVWRVPPPGMRWVAGYWNAAPGGSQWISGFWVPVEEKEIRYYEAPPASLEAGPTGPSPGDDYFWVTGSWAYYDTGFRWQPGYWAPYQEDWVWISSRFVWTPAGCIFLPGHWDYRLTRRGCLFAPVYFTQPLYTRPNYVYRPWCALNTPNLFVHLWVRPNYGHFYFGNYYGTNWNTWGVTPWCQYRPYRNCYDPMLTQLQCHYRQQGVNYINRLDGWHNHYSSNAAARPPRTWNEQVRIVNNTTINNININKTNITNITNIKQNILAVNLQDATRRDEMPVKFARLDGNMQKQALNLAKETRDVRKHRISAEQRDGKVLELVKEDPAKRGDGKVLELVKEDPAKRGNGKVLELVKEDPTKRGDGKVLELVKDESSKPGAGKSERDKSEPGKLDLNKADLGKRGSEESSQRPGKNNSLRLKLPTSQVTEFAKQPEKLAPPKLSHPSHAAPSLKLPGDVNKNRDEGRGSKAPGLVPKAKDEMRGENLKGYDLQPRSKPKPGVEMKNLEPGLHRPPPKIEIPVPEKSKVEAPKPAPKFEVPQPRPRAETPKAKTETPREQPQIKLDIPKPGPKPEPGPRSGSESQPKGNRKKPKKP